MSAPTRELAISYGAYALGGSTGLHPVGAFRYGKGPLHAWVEFDFLVVGTGVNDAAATADLLSKCAAADAAFRVPRAALVVTMNGTQLAFDPSSNSGFDHTPDVSTPEDDAQTGLSRLYRVRVDVELPADTFSSSGRADSHVDLGTPLNQRRSLEVAGEYRALGGNTARAQYLAAIAAYESALEGGFSGTWALLDEHADANDTNKIMQFRRTYREVYTTYLLEAQIALDYSEPNRRRTLTVTGTYLSSNPGTISARSIYLAQIGTFQTAITTAFGGTWYLAPETAKTEDNDARCDFRRVLYECYSGYLLRSRIDLSWTPSRLRRLLVAGTYVAGGVLGAYENYLAGGPTYGAAAYTALGGTWKLVGEAPIKDDNDQQCDFSLSYEEQNVGSAIGPLADPSVRQQDLSLRVSQPAPGDSPQGNAVRLKECTATFLGRIDRTVVVNLLAFYQTVVRPYLLGQIAAATNGGAAIVTNEAPDIQPDSSTIAVTIDAVVIGGAILEYEQATSRDVDPGNEIEGVWTKNPYDAYVWRSFVEDVITVRIKRRAVAGQAPLDPGGTRPVIDGLTWILLPYTRSAIPRRIGQAALANQLDVVDETMEVRWRGVNVLKGGEGAVAGTTNAPDLSGTTSSGPAGNQSLTTKLPV